jgi:CHASE3 domain sensor protein
MQAVLSSMWTRRLALFLAVLMGVLGMAPQSEAAFVSSTQTAADRTRDMDVVQKALESKLVAERLKDLGYGQDEIQLRLAQLSDQEIHQLASDIDAVAPAGDGLGILVTVLVIVILLLVILKLT